MIIAQALAKQTNIACQTLVFVSVSSAKDNNVMADLRLNQQCLADSQLVSLAKSFELSRRRIASCLLTLHSLKATITRCDLLPRLFRIDATLLCKFESDKV